MCGPIAIVFRKEKLDLLAFAWIIVSKSRRESVLLATSYITEDPETHDTQTELDLLSFPFLGQPILFRT
jgi:hypothetical protein